MKRGNIRILIFDILLIVFVLLNSFIGNILKNYTTIIFLGLVIFVFFKGFGLEKDKNFYTKSTILDITIVYLVSFILFYIFGIFIGFYRNDNYFTIGGIKNFIFPITVITILKEFLRYNVVKKSEKSKLLLIFTTITFIFLDLIGILPYADYNTKSGIFDLVAISLFPIISNNVVATYIAYMTGYKPNILWLLVAKLYVYVLPIIPNTGEYILAVIQMIFPFIILFILKEKFDKDNLEIEVYKQKNYFVPLLISSFLIIVMVYFTCGYFKYYAIAVASGSMEPNISKGDVVIVEKIDNKKNIEIGSVIAYKYNGVIVVHRLVKKEIHKDTYYYYSQGDANNDIDGYIIYEKDIIGIVKVKIPFVGFPTVWLSEL